MEQAHDRPATTALSAAARPESALRRQLARYFALTLLVVALDQATKALVRSRLAEGEAWPSTDALLAISHVENAGAAFGILQGAGMFLLIVTVIGIGAVLFYMWRFPPGQRLYVAALSLILGGAIGNLIDRVAKGTVTDFIDPAYYPAFNVADSAIVVGAATIVVLSFLEGRRA